MELRRAAEAQAKITHAHPLGKEGAAVEACAVAMAMQGNPDDFNPPVDNHDLRRSAVTNWSKVANMQTVMLMAGHSNIETTRRYYAATTDDQVARVREASADPIRKALESGQSDPKVTPEGDLRPKSSGHKVNKSLCNNKLRP